MPHTLPEKFRSYQAWAKLGISAMLAALLRCLAEYFRLKSVEGRALHLQSVEPFLTGGLITAIGISVAVGCFFAGKYKGAVIASAWTLLLLVLYKLLLLRAGGEIP
jgi:hypothetical protein